MATAALGVWITFDNGWRWQNYHVNQTVDGYDFMPMICSDFMVSKEADENALTIDLPATAANVAKVQNLIDTQQLATIRLHELENGSQLVASFYGEVVSANSDMVRVSVQFGLALDALTAQIPGLRITTALVGTLPIL